MIILKYRRIDPTVISTIGFYMLEEVLNGPADVVRIELWAQRNAEVLLCGKRVKIKNGAAEIAYGDLAEGVIEVEVISGGLSHFATPFLKTEDKILRLPTDEATFEALKAAYLELEGRVDTIETRICEIENEIRPKPLFDFN